MTDAATLGVLRDVYFMGMLALVMALFFYSWVRRMTGHRWNYDGNVMVAPYDEGDGLVALAMMGFVGLVFAQNPAAAAQSGAEGASGSGKNDTLNNIVQLLVGEGFFIVVCLSVVVYLRFFRGLNLNEMFGLRHLRPGVAALLALGWIVAVYLVMVLGVYVLQNIIHGVLEDETPQEAVKQFESSSSLIFKLLESGIAILVAPLLEETIFRGFLYGVTKRFTDRWFACFFTSVMFATVHYHVGSLIPLTLLAIGLSLAYEVTGCLLVPIFMHAIFNAFNIGQLVFG